MTHHDQIIESARANLDRFHIEELTKAGITPDNVDFVPVVRYPEMTWYPKVDVDEIFSHESERAGIPYAAYVHVPFCASSCHYCHWIKLIDPPQDVVERYIDAVSKEMEIAVKRLSRERLPISTVLFGGGTPTFLTARQWERLLGSFTKYFDLGKCRQFSVEAEPSSLLGQVGHDRLKVLKEFGVDRISLGVQCFDDRLLAIMGRTHTSADVFQAIDNIKKAGFESVSLDLIYGYPDQSIADWINSMQAAIQSGADAWQLYRLRILQHGLTQGVIIKQYKKHPESFPDPSKIRLMKMLGNLISEDNGFAQHFTRIFATDNKHTTHFMWDYCCHLTNVVGLGPSSWSNYHRTFTVNAQGFEDYLRLVDEGKMPVERGLFRDEELEARRSLITPLKNDRVYKKRYEKRLGFGLNERFMPDLERLKSFGLLSEDENSFFLTERGRFFADETVTQLFQKKYLPSPNFPIHDLMPD